MVVNLSSAWQLDLYVSVLAFLGTSFERKGEGRKGSAVPAFKFKGSLQIYRFRGGPAATMLG
eukprot:scaffold976_cov14-Tisochrysis_lutea.AAC.1